MACAAWLKTLPSDYIGEDVASSQGHHLWCNSRHLTIDLVKMSALRVATGHFYYDGY